jgi:hypothetical protein
MKPASGAFLTVTFALLSSCRDVGHSRGSVILFIDELHMLSRWHTSLPYLCQSLLDSTYDGQTSSGFNRLTQLQWLASNIAPACLPALVCTTRSGCWRVRGRPGRIQHTQASAGTCREPAGNAPARVVRTPRCLPVMYTRWRRLWWPLRARLCALSTPASTGASSGTL